ncbi:uncharacterized protein LOC103723884 isoform X2 [Phoenix dactylifera]|uniref:Uncharacterized protein LOC103723884 isoform X2 n=1 Tax=Phoenix dactylifera TaxID=42345 RepID=A0A8B9ABD2_PHODC|nr:uncharacterized protein LOC103723884 isoform X2 [Phoenix dactylifera]
MACGICNPSLRPSILPHRPTALKENCHVMFFYVHSYCSDQLVSNVHGARVQASLVSRISGQAAPRPAMKLSRPNNIISFDITMGCCQNLLMPVRYLCVSVASCKTEDSNVIITGYWMGPDIEDGWGFVEAAVDRNI